MVQRRKKKQSAFSTLQQVWAELRTAFQIFMIGAKNRRRLYRKLAFRMEQGLKAQEAVRSLLDDMVPPSRTPEQHEKNLEKVRTKTFMGRMLNHAEISLRDKGEVATAFEGWVPESDLLIIRGADHAKTHSETFLELNRINEKLRRVQTLAIISAITPIAFFLLGITAIIAMSVQISPMILDTSAQNGMTTSQELMLTVSAVTLDWWKEITVAVAGILIVGVMSLPMRWGRLEWLRIKLDKIPPWSLYRKVSGIRFFAALTLMVKNEMIGKAMQKLRDSSKNEWLNLRIESVLPIMVDGKNLGIALRKVGYDFPDKEIIADLVTLSGGGNQEAIIKEVCDEWMNTIVEEIETQSKIIRNGSVVITVGFAVIIMMALQDTFNAVTNNLPNTF